MTYTISCRQTIEYEAVVEAESEALARFEAEQECRRYGQVVDYDLTVIKER